MDISQDFFHDAWAELLIKKLSEDDKKSVCQVDAMLHLDKTFRYRASSLLPCNSLRSLQVSTVARELVHRLVERLRIHDVQLLNLERFANLKDLQITG